ncbi:hypothetical protein WR25_19430 [Diploscapter pachys]|uniref:Peptidase M12A domain-containing protein n=1 Tax=Diploscapter pachys TaxID=2018661 RepID=A0A2A2L416_9BILA|nr:hypothetical protein WR25_19430 [Diploscapter pachys]
MLNSFPIWVVAALAHLPVSFSRGSREGGGVTPKVNQFDSLKPITQQALRKYMADPEDTRRRLAAMIPNIPQDQAALDRIHQKLGGLTVDLSVSSINPSVVNAKAGVSPYLLQGDIVVTDDQLKQMEDEYKRFGGRKKRQAAIPIKKWPQNTIHYYFHNVSAKSQQAVAAGLKVIQQQTCINFVKSSTAANRIRVINADGCWSPIGMKGGEQDLSLESNGCDLQGTAATCTAAQNQIKCLNAGMKNPRNCSTCICPVGYAGATCNQRPNNGGKTIIPTANWQTMTITVGNSASSANTWRPSYMIKTYWFTVPTGRKLEMKITGMQNSHCNYGCSFASLEFKYGPYPELVDPKYCCPEHLNKVYSSTRNPTVLNAHNEYYFSTFTIQYRLVAASG